MKNSMEGKYSLEQFFQDLPEIIQTYFQGSESSNTEDVENLFKIAKEKLKQNSTQEEIISMILFDELGLAEKSKKNPLKVLHSKLENSDKQKEEKEEKEEVSFVGISNYSLDAAKLNRALILSVPDLDQKLNDLLDTTRSIIENISEELIKEGKKEIFEIISKTYFEYKSILIIFKELMVLKQYITKNKDQNLNLEQIQFSENKKKKRI